MTAALPPLSATEFSSFFTDAHAAMHGAGAGAPTVHPFPWQRRLVEEVASRGSWPEVLDLPTGSGKTAVLLAAVFLLALDGEAAPRRTVMVVDRRVVVDQSFELASALARAISSATTGVLDVVRERLKVLTGGEGPPLVAARLRGGVARNDDWSLRPDQPAVISSTVDQVGSRLLFQGYGVSARMRPIHAGLLGRDSLIILDEVHLSLAFAQTLDRLQDLQATQSVPGRPSRHVLLSATLGKAGASLRTLPIWVDGERESEDAAPLVRRLGAPKRARLEGVKVPTGRAAGAGVAVRAAVAQAAAKAAGELLARSSAGAIGVVVNRVDTAREIWRLLKGDVPGAEIVLLTGRARPVERDRLVRPLKERVGAGRKRGEAASPTVVVATQCIEAGADYDFDGLVTECASLDALRQRFGRVDRLGELAALDRPSLSVVLGPSSTVGSGANDPVYGTAIPVTWDWLNGSAEAGEVDFGCEASAWRDPAPDAALAPSPGAPWLLPRELDCWAERQERRDAPVPDVARFLHGDDDTAVADVQLVWRCDVTEELLYAASNQDQAARELALSIVAFCPPRSAEAVAVPVWAVASWLLGAKERSSSDEGDLADVEGERTDITESQGVLRPFLVWEGEASVASSSTSDLRPGATVVVPSSYGGVREDTFDGTRYGFWDPLCTDFVTDVAEEARNQAATGRWCKRLLPGVLDGGETLPSREVEQETAKEVVERWYEGEASGVPWPKGPYSAREFVAISEGWLPDGVAFDPQSRQGSWFAATGRFPPGVPEVEADLDDSDDGEATTDPESSPFTGEQVTLEEHLAGVARRARTFAARCGLPDDLGQDLELAGGLHDIGKRDRRFQAWLRDGYPMPGEEYLAKSVLPATDRQRVQRALKAARYPRGARHEALSVALLADASRLPSGGHDWELVQHLVASHHGWARPFFPAVVDDDPVTVELECRREVLRARSDHTLADVGSIVPERFWSLVERYGHYGLAYLEAILRLADHVESAMSHATQADGGRRKA